MRITQILLGTLAVLGPLAAAQDDVYGDAAAEIGSPEVEIANDAPIVDAHTPDVDAKDASTGAPVDTETFRYEVSGSYELFWKCAEQ
jgi:hypothetical protein